MADDPPPLSSEPVSSSLLVAPSKPRRLRRIVVAFLLIVLAAGLVAGVFLVDGFAKDFARDYLREQTIEILGLEPDAEVVVRLEGSMLLQALAGRLRSVDIVVSELSFGGLIGSATVHAEDVPFDQNAPVGTLYIEFAIAEEDLVSLADSLSGLDLDSIVLAEPEIVVTTSFGIFGFTIPVGMGLAPSAIDGQLAFTPTSVLVGDDSFSAEQLLRDPLFGLVAQSLLQQQSVCVAQYLPQAFVVTEVEVRGSLLVLGITGDGAALGGPEMQTRGRCTP